MSEQPQVPMFPVLSRAGTHHCCMLLAVYAERSDSSHRQLRLKRGLLQPHTCHRYRCVERLGLLAITT